MNEIKSWCFLCASSNKDVSVEISFLDDWERELIGTFSIINFSLVSSRICLGCDKFLKEHERRKELYGRVESMYMEILKKRNKLAIDVRAIRAKYQIGHEKSKDQPELSESLLSIFQLETDQLEGTEQTDAVLNQNHVQVIEVIRSPEQEPTLLNPTLLPPSKTQAREKFECDLCCYSSINKTKLISHVEGVHKRPSKTSPKCAICSKIFRSSNSLQSHLKSHHLDKPKIQCPECNKCLSSRSALACHRQTIHMQTRDFQCSGCPKAFATKGACNEHEKIHLPAKIRSCPVCSKKFKTSSALGHHIDIHEATEYSCPECGKCLNTKRTLRMHQLTHSAVTKFACQFCQSQFKRVKDYKEHLITVHTSLRPYSCDWCSRTFSNGPNCRKHKRQTHPAEVAAAVKSGEKVKVKLPTIDELIEIIAKNTTKTR